MNSQENLDQEQVRIIRRTVAEIDPVQMEIFRKFTPAQRVRLGAALTDIARKLVAEIISQQEAEGS